MGRKMWNEKKEVRKRNVKKRNPRTGVRGLCVLILISDL
jgi:hypothetical protein